MKKTICILLSVYSILTYSCKKDKKETASIIGKWYWVEQTYDDYTNDKLTDHRDYTTTLDPLSYFEFKTPKIVMGFLNMANIKLLAIAYL